MLNAALVLKILGLLRLPVPYKRLCTGKCVWCPSWLIKIKFMPSRGRSNCKMVDSYKHTPLFFW